jgi:Molecular chaperone (small heat shock protein)
LARCRAWRGLPRLVRAPEAGYPPYNIELLTGEDGSPSGLRITLAVAGFSVDELAVTIEGGELIVRGKQADERSRLHLPGHRGAQVKTQLRARRRGRGAQGRTARRAARHRARAPDEGREGQTVRIVDGEVAAKRRDALPPKPASVSDAE